jgi:hypothetical protein
LKTTCSPAVARYPSVTGIFLFFHQKRKTLFDTSITHFYCLVKSFYPKKERKLSIFEQAIKKSVGLAVALFNPLHIL